MWEDKGIEHPISNKECAVRLQGQLLDGRNRDMACKKLGVKLTIVDFIGTEQQAFDYVTNANRFQRDLEKSQRATIAVRLIPYISPETEQKRLERLKATWERKREEGSLEASLSASRQSKEPEVRTRAIAAQIMGVSEAYVRDALRVQRESPELFEKIWSGHITINAALHQLDGVTDADEVRQIRALRREQNAILRDPDRRSNFVKLWNQLLAQFRDAG